MDIKKQAETFFQALCAYILQTMLYRRGSHSVAIHVALKNARAIPKQPFHLSVTGAVPDCAKISILVSQGNISILVLQKNNNIPC